MRLETSIKRKRALINEVQSCTARVVREQLTHTRYLDLISHYVYNHRYWDIVPAWVRRSVVSYLDGQRDMIWVHFSHWRVRYNGKLVVGAKSVPAGEWHKVQQGAQVWNSNPDAIYSDSLDSE